MRAGPYRMFSRMLMGNGLGCWNTMPTCTRSALGSVLNMSVPLNSTRPSVRTPSTKSHMRLNVRRSVDLPQPEGPMKAVARCSGISSETSLSAWKSVYQRLKCFTEMTGETSATLLCSVCVNSFSIISSINQSVRTGSRQAAGHWVTRRSAWSSPSRPWCQHRRTRCGLRRGWLAPCCASR